MLDLFFFFKQKTAYEMRISDWSSDVCSSDLRPEVVALRRGIGAKDLGLLPDQRLLRQHVQSGRPESAIGQRPHQRSSEERRVGKKCDSKRRTVWYPYH